MGLTNYLVGECALEETLLKDNPFGFDVLRAGTIPPNPGELIHSDKMAELLDNLRKEYAYIVMDTSPIGLVPDAYTLIELSDLCLFVIRCKQTSKAFCKQTIQQMTVMVENKEKVQLVLSDIPNEGRYAYGYGNAYGYGYGYDYGYGHRYGRARNSYGKYGAYIYDKFHHMKNGKNQHYYDDDDEA